jgi:hypothetical protein
MDPLTALGVGVASGSVNMGVGLQRRSMGGTVPGKKWQMDWRLRKPPSAVRQFGDTLSRMVDAVKNPSDAELREDVRQRRRDKGKSKARVAVEKLPQTQALRLLGSMLTGSLKAPAVPDLVGKKAGEGGLWRW